MITKNQIRFVKSLQQKKCRIENNLFVVEGRKNVEELLKSNFSVQTLYCSKLKELPESANEYEEVSDNDMKRMSGMKTPPGILALVLVDNAVWKKKTNGITILLDELKDPGNLGTILRTAEWFGVQRIICSNSSVEIWNPKVVQATMGAVFQIPVFYENLAEVIPEFKSKGVKICSAVLGGENLYQTQFHKDTVIIIGSESHGISKEIVELSDKLITIPSFGKSESLNASIACAIIVGEVKSQLV